ncbi:uncharacterized protein G2W53_015936 [Senna tora]|uniref:Uncharacterized protein n=1 Tax=Senna tora TaxID=362788 RepID=A0A834WVV1_9FABA|nr:uncharacterized protein G2W53_015936 [Senna tora]
MIISNGGSRILKKTSEFFTLYAAKMVIIIMLALTNKRPFKMTFLLIKLFPNVPMIFKKRVPNKNSPLSDLEEPPLQLLAYLQFFEISGREKLKNMLELPMEKMNRKQLWELKVELEDFKQRLLKLLAEKSKKCEEKKSLIISNGGSRILKKTSEFFTLYAAKMVIIIMLALTNKRPFKMTFLLIKLFPNVPMIFKKRVPNKNSPLSDLEEPPLQLLAYLQFFEIKGREKLKNMLELPMEKMNRKQLWELKVNQIDLSYKFWRSVNRHLRNHLNYDLSPPNFHIPIRGSLRFLYLSNLTLFATMIMNSAKMVIIIMLALTNKPPFKMTFLLIKLFPNVPMIFKRMVPNKISPLSDLEEPPLQLLSYLQFFEIKGREKLKNMLELPMEKMNRKQLWELKRSVNRHLKNHLNYDLSPPNFHIPVRGSLRFLYLSNLTLFATMIMNSGEENKNMIISNGESRILKKTSEFFTLYAAKMVIIIMLALTNKPPFKMTFLLIKLFPNVPMIFKKRVPNKISPLSDLEEPPLQLLAYLQFFEIKGREKLKNMLDLPMEKMNRKQLWELKVELEDFKQQLVKLLAEKSKKCC